MSMDRPRLIVGISGASGFQYGLKALQLLRAVGGVEVHLVLSKGAEMTRALETAITRDEVIFPPVPAFYAQPQTVDDIVTHSVARALDLFGIDVPALPRWDGGRMAHQGPAESPGSVGRCQ